MISRLICKFFPQRATGEEEEGEGEAQEGAGEKCQEERPRKTETQEEVGVSVFWYQCITGTPTFLRVRLGCVFRFY
jgi:hypothetical protein